MLLGHTPYHYYYMPVINACVGLSAIHVNSTNPQVHVHVKKKNKNYNTFNFLSGYFFRVIQKCELSVVHPIIYRQLVHLSLSQDSLFAFDQWIFLVYFGTYWAMLVRQTKGIFHLQHPTNQYHNNYVTMLTTRWWTRQTRSSVFCDSLDCSSEWTTILLEEQVIQLEVLRWRFGMQSYLNRTCQQ